MPAATLKPHVNPPYKIKESLIIAQCDDMRVIDQTLAPGESVPWHFHPTSADYVVCLRGELQIRQLNPERVTTLRALERYSIAEKQPHTTVNASEEDCQFLIIQGPGKVQFVAVPKLQGAVRSGAQ